MPLALFDLDDTLVDRGRAFQAWAEEFVIRQGLDDAALTFLYAIDAEHAGPDGRLLRHRRSDVQPGGIARPVVEAVPPSHA